jgi:hypothetical protein
MCAAAPLIQQRADVELDGPTQRDMVPQQCPAAGAYVIVETHGGGEDGARRGHEFDNQRGGPVVVMREVDAWPDGLEEAGLVERTDPADDAVCVVRAESGQQQLCGEAACGTVAAVNAQAVDACGRRSLTGARCGPVGTDSRPQLFEDCVVATAEQRRRVGGEACFGEAGGQPRYDEDVGLGIVSRDVRSR